MESMKLLSLIRKSFFEFVIFDVVLYRFIGVRITVMFSIFIILQTLDYLEVFFEIIVVIRLLTYLKLIKNDNNIKKNLKKVMIN